MATTTLLSTLDVSTEENSVPLCDRPNLGLVVVTLLTVVAFGIGGYHPFSEDGGLYMAGIKQLLDPGLYARGSEFVQGHLPYSLFVPGIAWLTAFTGLRLSVVLLVLHLGTWWLTLYAGWLLAYHCFSSSAARFGSVGLLALWLTLPVAGTSLMLMDPYLTARSISTPCGLLALAGALTYKSLHSTLAARRRGLLLCLSSLLIACSMHLLMGMYTVSAVVLLLGMLSRRPRTKVLLLCGSAVAIACVVQSVAPAEGAGYVRSAITRSYWFITRWEWYEQFGLVAPLAILAFTGIRASRLGKKALAALTMTAFAAGTTAVIIAILFARPGLSSLLVARLQPLRIFQFVYAVMILIVGAWFGDRILKRNWLRWAASFVILGGAMLYVQRQIYPNSNHLELPGKAPRNLWVQSFQWIEKNTPVDATFAIDAHYIGAPGEDAQTFRAIAERSVLPDYSKDGGEASISPAMSAAWIKGVEAQTNLGTQSDDQRIEQLHPLGVTWLVLSKSDATDFTCPYTNSLVKVCRLP